MGWVALVCADKATLQWLRTTMSTLKPLEGPSPKLSEKKYLSHKEILMGYFPSTQDYANKKIPAFSEAQNTVIASVTHMYEGFREKSCRR